MHEHELIVLGRIKTVFGVKGWLKVESFTEPVENILKYKVWIVECAGQRIQLIVDEYKQRPKDMIVHFVGLDDREDAQKFSQCLINVPNSKMPELDNEEYYWHQLEGLNVYQISQTEQHDGLSGDETLIGVVDRLLETGANDVLVVSKGVNNLKAKQEEILIPYLPDTVVKRIDLKGGYLLVDWYYD